MTLRVDVEHSAGQFNLSASFEAKGRLTALFGPSGAGKTMLINMIGGLLRPDCGVISVEGRVLVDTATKTFLPPHKRRIGYVFQDARLFPHLTVCQNLRFGRFFSPRAGRWADEGAIIDLLGIGHLLDRRPSLLSGGETSRVAIGRALLASPHLLLMDEPLAALDEARRREILPFIERLRDEMAVPIVYVSHSVAEVARLASDVVMLRDGRVTASGPTDQVLSRLDLLPEPEQGEGGALLDLKVVGPPDCWGLTPLRSRGGEWRLPDVDAAPGTHIRVRVRARDVMLATSRPDGVSAINMLEGRVASMEPASASEMRVAVDCSGDLIMARITRFSASALELAPGKPVFAIVKAASFDRSNTGIPVGRASA